VVVRGGMGLPGNALSSLQPDVSALLRALLPRVGVAARCADAEWGVGTAEVGGGRLVFLLNAEEALRTFSFRLARPHRLRERWTGEDLGARTGEVALTLPARSGRVVVCTPEA